MTARFQQKTLSEPVTISDWWKGRSRRESIRVRLSTYESHNVIDVRAWFTDAEGKMRPGKGFCCSVRHLEKLIEALGRANHKAIELGLIEDGGGDRDGSD